MAEHTFLKVQSTDQLGFTSKISYLLASVERGECQRYSLDTKQACYGVSFDGQAAFPSVDRDIQSWFLDWSHMCDLCMCGRQHIYIVQ